MSDQSTTAPPITCHASRWYLYKRFLPLLLGPFLMAGWFYYDWKIGWPKKLKIYQEYLPYKQQNREVEWKKYAAEKGWPEEPDEYTQEKIDGQANWFYGCLIVGIFTAAYALWNYPKKLQADATSFTPPGGERIDFQSVFRVDRRKWKHKGLAYVYYKKDGQEKKAVLDDLRFTGADQILDRLVNSGFDGEIIDIQDDSDNPEAPEEKPTAEVSEGDPTQKT